MYQACIKYLPANKRWPSISTLLNLFQEQAVVIFTCYLSQGKKNEDKQWKDDKWMCHINWKISSEILSWDHNNLEYKIKMDSALYSDVGWLNCEWYFNWLDQWA